MAGEPCFAQQQRPNAEQNVAGELGLLAGEAAREIVGGDVLVDRVGLDVLVEELRRLRAEAEPP